jgi:hypothetical protein
MAAYYMGKEATMKIAKLLTPLIIFVSIAGCNQQPSNETAFDSESMWQANITDLPWTHDCRYRSLTYNFKVLDWENFRESSLIFQNIFDESSLLRDLKFKSILKSITNSNIGFDSLLIKAEYEFESMPGLLRWQESLPATMSGSQGS